MPNALRNNLLAEHALREARRGGMLDKHRGETGLQQELTIGNQVDVLQLSSENRANPIVVTVGVDVTEVSPRAVNGSPTIQLQTVISWGTGKGVNSAIVDTRVGGQITLAANILNVAVRYPIPDPVPVGASTVFLVSGSVAYTSAVPSRISPALTFTDALIAIAQGGTSLLRPIPKYATGVAYVSDGNPTANTAPNAVLRFFGHAAGTATIVEQANPDPNVFVAIPNGAYFVDIRNSSPGPPPLVQGFRLIFELGL